MEAITKEKVLDFNLKNKDRAINHAKRLNVNINLTNPVTIQDKLEWLNIYDINPLKWDCADKINLHEYSKKKIGKDICIPLICTYNNVNEIDWNILPEKFVIKCNHGSGMNIIITQKSKTNKQTIYNKLNTWLKDDFSFRNGFESHYHWIKPRILVEEYKNDGHKDLIDYKFLCFNGNPIYCQVIGGRNEASRHLNYYDMNFNFVDICRTDFRNNSKITDNKPINFEQMKEYAKILSEDFKFVRVDFYEIDGILFLGELTFTPGCNHFKYTNHQNEIEVGNLLRIK